MLIHDGLLHGIVWCFPGYGAFLYISVCRTNFVFYHNLYDLNTLSFFGLPVG